MIRSNRKKYKKMNDEMRIIMERVRIREILMNKKKEIINDAGMRYG